jgi:hypothetical protein
VLLLDARDPTPLWDLPDEDAANTVVAGLLRLLGGRRRSSHRTGRLRRGGRVGGEISAA